MSTYSIKVHDTVKPNWITFLLIDQDGQSRSSEIQNHNVPPRLSEAANAILTKGI